MAAALAAMCIAGLGGAAQASAHDPILFVHGWSSSGSVWNTMIGNFQRDGWTAAELNSWSYNTSESNATTAAQIRDKVNRSWRRRARPRSTS